MHTILGANPSSRLFMNLRESKGYTYGAYSNLDARRDAGMFRQTAEVRTPVTGDSLKEFFYELERIRAEPVSDKEMQDAKSFLTGVFPIRLETQEGLIDQLVQIKMYDLPADYLQTYRDRVNAVTKEDVQRVARRYIAPDQAAIVIVGDAAAIMDQVKSYATEIEIYDSEGRRKELDATPSAAESAAAAKAAGLLGAWSIQIETPAGQPLSATLTMRDDGGQLSGTVETQMGQAQMSHVAVSGAEFSASLIFTMQGQSVEGTAAGHVETNRITGTITLSIPNAPPFKFSGARKQD
jgi:zinc protease